MLPKEFGEAIHYVVIYCPIVRRKNVFIVAEVLKEVGERIGRSTNILSEYLESVDLLCVVHDLYPLSHLLILLYAMAQRM